MRYIDNFAMQNKFSDDGKVMLQKFVANFAM